MSSLQSRGGFAGQAVIVTGASSGIGLATAKRAAEAGARLVLAARNEEALRTICEEIKQHGGSAVYAVADVGKMEDVQGIRWQSSMGCSERNVQARRVSQYGVAPGLALFEQCRSLGIQEISLTPGRNGGHSLSVTNSLCL